jgi:hypothetical protein
MQKVRWDSTACRPVDRRADDPDQILSDRGGNPAPADIIHELLQPGVPRETQFAGRQSAVSP